MFTHLHVHTEYSLLDGLCRIPLLIAKAKEYGMNSLAITDHGNMYGVIDFYLAAKEAGIKPIIGCEVYVAQTKRQNRDPREKTPYHLTLLARNQRGYENLLQLITKSNLEGFYYKPRVDKELLQEYQEGLIALSGCLHGELSRLILENRLEDAEKQAQWYRDTFNHYFIEIQRHPIPELEQVNKELTNMSLKLNIPLVATNDVHYINKEDASTHELLLCIQTNTSIYNEKRMKMAGNFFYLKSPEEMTTQFADLPESISNTEKIADLCDLKLEFGKLHLPKVEIPGGKDAFAYLSELCWSGLKQRFQSPPADVEQRLSYELDVIKETHFSDYFLVVWDLISYAKKQNILFGIRGSAAASLALYCLGITEIDPLAHKLVFERFLNIERRELPDIDLDFQDDRRDEILDYVKSKYGSEHVAQIITFGTLGARAAIRDVGRALGISYGQADRVARLISPRPNTKLDDALMESRELNSYYSQDESIKNLIDNARKLEGTARHASTHAAGVVISEEALINYLPLQRVSKDNEDSIATTQYSMENIARLGLLKMDFLGLANLTLLAKAKDIIAQSRGIDMDLQNIPLDDALTFRLLSSGETSGIFQLESEGMRRYIKELKPTNFNDISAMVALYRPGPMEHIPRFIKAKQGIEAIHYPHPILKEILEETYGVIVYQDQVLLIVQALAGYSLGQADIFRKAMGKKIAQVMKKERDNFLNGARNNNISEQVATDVFTLIEPFAGYAFNKAHSVSYARIAYETAYLKANFTIEFMTALLNTYSSNTDKVRSAIMECHRLDIPVFPPDVNNSDAAFSIEQQDGREGIRFSLTAIKNIGLAAIEPVLIARREGGQFNSIEDFCYRVDLRGINKKVLESLIKAGAFDKLALRGALLQVMSQMISLSQREKQLKERGQASMFDLWGESVSVPLPGLNLETEDVPVKDKLYWEKELLGVYFSEHPFASIAPKLANTITVLCGQIDKELVGQSVTVAGIVNSIRYLYTKDKRPFIIANLEDLDGIIEVTVWSKVYEETKELWQEGEILLVEGKVRAREDQININCLAVRRYQSEEKQHDDIVEEKAAASQYRLTIVINEDGAEQDDVQKINTLIDILNNYPGQDIVHLVITGHEDIVKLELPSAHYCPELTKEITSIIGGDCLNIEEVMY